MLIRYILLTVWVGLLLPSAALAFSVEARVDRLEISQTDSLTLEIAMEGGEGEVDTSGITDFEILSRRSSSSIQIINGDYSRNVSQVFQLMPLKAGSLTIPALAVGYQKKTYHTRPITIQVLPPSKQPQAATDIFVRASLSHDRLYVGQQGIYRFQVLSAVAFSNARLQKPDFEGFMAEEMGDPRRFTRTIKGRRYNGVEIAYLIVPVKPGPVTIQAAQLTCDVAVEGRSSGFDPFDDPFFNNGFFSRTRTRPRRLATRALDLEVAPLPAFQGQGHFSGLVGEFTLEADLDRNRLKAGDSATLTLTLSGRGNIRDARIPDLELPEGIKSYADTPVETVHLTARGYEGEKVFKLALVPVRAGKYRIPEVTLVFFDPDTAVYRTLKVPAMVLDAVPDPDAPLIQVQSDGPSGNGDGPAIKETVMVTGRDILALKVGPEVMVSRSLLSWPVFTGLYVFPAVLFALFMAGQRFWRKEEAPSAVSARASEHRLKQAHTAAEDGAFLKHLYDAVACRVLSRSGKSPKPVTTDDARDLLEQADVDSDVSEKTLALLGELESVRYSGGTLDADGRHALLKRVETLLKMMSVAAVMILITGGTPLRAATQEIGKPSGGVEVADIQNQAISGQAGDVAAPEIQSREISKGGLLLDAVRAYQEGRYRESAGLFTALAEQGIDNGGLFYNAGNAWLKAGDVGRAILWYERALERIPRDPDLRFNLSHARSQVRDKAEGSGLDLSDLLLFRLNRLSPRVTVWTAVGLSFLFWGYAGVRRFLGRRIFTPAGILFLCLVILSGLSVGHGYYRKVHRHAAVILAPEAPVRSGLSPDATALFVLHAGTRVSVEQARDGYLKIVFSKDKRGWISNEDAEMI